MNLFIQVQATYTDQQWPERADLMSFDVGLHMGFLTSISKEEPSGLKRNEEGSVRERTSQTSKVRRSRESKLKKEKETKQDQTLGPIFESHDPELHADLTAVAKSALTWCKVFVTRQGCLGLGPNWLNIGDTVMVIHGAPVPYAFTPLETDLGRREGSIRAGMDKNQIKYNETVKALQNSGKKKLWKPLDAVIHNR
jgi:hypothetical protein